MDPIPSTTAEIMNFYYEGNRDPGMARELCLVMATQRLYDLLQYDTDDTGGLDSEALGLMKAFGIDPSEYSYYLNGTYYTAFPESMTQVQARIGSQKPLDTNQIVDYIFRSSVSFLIDHIDMDRTDTLFDDIKLMVKGGEINPYWIWSSISDRLSSPANLNIDKATMEEAMEVLAEAYVAVVAHDPE